MSKASEVPVAQLQCFMQNHGSAMPELLSVWQNAFEDEVRPLVAGPNTFSPDDVNSRMQSIKHIVTHDHRSRHDPTYAHAMHSLQVEDPDRHAALQTLSSVADANALLNSRT